MDARRAAVGVVLSFVALSLLFAGAAGAAAAPPPACAASQSWVTNPNPPQEIPGGGSDFCQFYQFAWQWFLYLVSPSGDSAGDRNFEVQQTFPLLQASGTDSCTATSNTPVFFVRTLKSEDPNQPFIVPENIGQAGTQGEVIYDKSGNIVFYEVRFSRNLCPPPTSGNLPAGTTEIKTAWRQITQAEAPAYFTNQAVIQGVSTQPILLGLIGFHLFRTTAQHPEGVWMTWEHESNDPDCLQPQPTPAAGWSFTSAQCAQCLATSTTGPLACPSCNFNTAMVSTKISGGTPTQICRVYRDGSGPMDNKVAENLADVDSLNAQLVGPSGFVTQLPASNPVAVFANYYHIGGLWVSDPTQPADSANQRGSLQLANTVMETTFQGNFTASGSGVMRSGAVNCFGCHSYTPNSTATSGLSHIVDDLDGTPGNAPKAGSGGGGSAAAAHGSASAGVEPVASHKPYGSGQN
ncbi:MAG TPA: hypothetical protein VGS57_11060 [Thermoanaerobaculia bacterium]|nr:hypothetical protein [Thermoanaerobaculia bacterium]